MKQFLQLTFFFLLSFSVAAQHTQGVIWETGTLEETLQKVQKNKKGPQLIFVDCYTSWCGPCKYMANTVFPMTEAGDYFNAGFLNIKIDMEKGEGPQVKKKYDVRAYPTFLILDMNGHEVGRVVDSDELQPFIRKIEKAKNIQNSPKWLLSAFNNQRIPETAMAYAKGLMDSYMKKEACVFLSEHIELIGASNLFSEGFWPYFKQALTSIGTDLCGMQRFVERNKAYAAERVGNDQVVETLLKSYQRVFFAFFTRKDRVSVLREDVVKAVEYTKILSSSQNDINYILADIIEKQLAGDQKGLNELYNFNKYATRSFSDWQLLENIFRGIPEISQQQRDVYAAAKKQYLERLINR